MTKLSFKNDVSQMIFLQGIDMLRNARVFNQTLTYIQDDINLKDVFHSMQGSYALCLLANMIQLAYLNREDLIDPVQHGKFCVSFAGTKKRLSTNN